MAKRFTDTDKWKKPWFRALPLKMKLAWMYVCDNCDHAGIWPADFELLSFQIGERVGEMDFRAHFNGKFQLLDGGKLYIPSFVEFQYGELNPENRAHKSVLKILSNLAPSKPLPSSSAGAKDKDKDKDQEKDQVQEKEESAKLKSETEEACEVFRETLRFFKAGRTLLPGEVADIARAIQGYTFKSVCLALEGMRHEPKSDTYDPAKFCSLGRVFKNRDSFTRFLTLGTQAHHARPQPKAQVPLAEIMGQALERGGE